MKTNLPKLIDEPRWQSAEYIDELAQDRRTLPMLQHYLIVAVAERSDCDPTDEPAYDALVERLANAAVRGDALHRRSRYFTEGGAEIKFPAPPSTDDTDGNA